MSTNPKIISLYSFKGGAGRTVSTANLAGIYATEIGATADSPILLMDLDVDSAGLTLFFKESEAFKGSPWGAAKIVSGELSVGISSIGNRFFSEGVVDVSEKVVAPPRSVLFLGSEVMGPQESTPVGGRADEAMSDFFDFCGKHNVSTVLMDSASGRQEVAHLCHQVSDVIVYCCRMTNQFLTGTEAQIEHFVEYCKEHDVKLPSIVLLPVAVPKSSEMWKEAEESAFITLDGIRNTIGGLAESDLIDFLRPGVCEVESFKWFESVLRTKAKGSLAKDEEVAIDAYKLLAAKLSELLSTNR